MKISRPTEKECPPNSYQFAYIQLVTDENVLDAFQKSSEKIIDFFSALPQEKHLYRYAEGKWTLKEVLGHIIDTERIMMFRVLCIARGEQQSLPGFEQDDYIETANFNKRSLKSLLQEYKLVRKSNLLMIKNLDTKALKRIGKANNMPLSARAIIWMVAGHELHHLRILEEKYTV